MSKKGDVKKRLLFVCLGNICRSPAAEGIMNTFLQQQGLDQIIECKSAGTCNAHEGEPADARMIEFASERGHKLESYSRGFQAPEDFKNFDYIFTMDKSNYRNVLRLDGKGDYHSKVIPITRYCKIHNVEEVPDPYYQGDDGFHLVLDILEDACNELIAQLKNDLGKK